MNGSVIVYRNPLEAAFWDFIMNNGYMILVFFATFMFVFTMLWKFLPDIMFTKSIGERVTQFLVFAKLKSPPTGDLVSRVNRAFRYNVAEERRAWYSIAIAFVVTVWVVSII